MIETLELTEDTVCKALIDAVKSIQEESGEGGERVSISTKPFMGLPHFDSLRSLEVCMKLSSEFDTDIGPPQKNPFESNHGCEVSIAQVAKALFSQLNKGR